MDEVFSYIIGLGASVMMPIIFTILGIALGIKPGKALHAGLYVGVGFVGLSVVTALLTSSLGPALSKVVEIYNLKLSVFDMGWPAAASVAYNTAVGAFVIPVCVGVNIRIFRFRLAVLWVLCSCGVLYHHSGDGRCHGPIVSEIL